MRLDNKVAIITGANSGIGKKIGEMFIAEGSKVVFSDLIENNSFVDDFKENARYVKCNVSKPEEVDNLIFQADKLFGRIDVIVNNAGIGALGGIIEVTNKDWDNVISVNLSGTMYGMRAAANYMKKNKIEGSIINISSILGKVGFNGAIAYCASKGGVVQLTHAGALDLASEKIRVNAIAPGFIKTNMTKDVLENDSFNTLVTSSTPLGYVGETGDIANAAIYLASDESKYMTGNVLYVDGGWTAK